MLNDQAEQTTTTPHDTTERLNNFVKRQKQKVPTKDRSSPKSSVARAGLKPLLDALTRGDYVAPGGTMTKAEHIGHFVYWCSQRFPRIGVPNEMITMIIERLPRPAVKGSTEMKLVLGKMPGVKKALLEKYGRLTYQKDGTTRMLVDETDEALHIGPKVDKAAYRGLMRAKDFHDRQDFSKIAVTDANRSIIEQQQRASNLINEMVKQAEVALLPAKT
jgi:hypothetical protein